MAIILEFRNGPTYLSKLDATRIQSKRIVQKLVRYAEFALNEYVLAAKDEAQVQNEELATLVRQPQFFQCVGQRVQRNCRKQALAEKWLAEALPKL